MIRGGIFPHYQHQNQKPGFFTKAGFFGDKIRFGNHRASPDIVSKVGKILPTLTNLLELACSLLWT
jgi:hypothetical protein